MDHFLGLTPADRASAFEQCGVRIGLPAASIEKDFWVCLVLRELFALPEYGSHLTFKGGTSLSKAWALIERFSEDLDLTIDRACLDADGFHNPEEAPSHTERVRRLKRLKHACCRAVSERIKPALETRLLEILPAMDNGSLSIDGHDPDGQTLLWAFPRSSPEITPAYINPVIRLEFGARSDPWPAAHRQVTSYVAEIFPRLFVVPDCSVRALLPVRTFWEKVMLLHEETFRPADKARQPRLARHYYDIWRLIEAGVGDSAVSTPDLFDRVAAHRQLYFRHTWVDYKTLKRGQIRLIPLPGQLEDWRKDYAAMQHEMFPGNPPGFDEIMAALSRFQEAFNTTA